MMLPGDVRDGWGVRGWRKYGRPDHSVTVMFWEPVPQGVALVGERAR